MFEMTRGGKQKFGAITPVDLSINVLRANGHNRPRPPEQSIVPEDFIEDCQAAVDECIKNFKSVEQDPSATLDSFYICNGINLTEKYFLNKLTPPELVKTVLKVVEQTLSLLQQPEKLIKQFQKNVYKAAALILQAYEQARTRKREAHSASFQDQHGLMVLKNCSNMSTYEKLTRLNQLHSIAALVEKQPELKSLFLELRQYGLHNQEAWEWFVDTLKKEYQIEFKDLHNLMIYELQQAFAKITQQPGRAEIMTVGYVKRVGKKPVIISHNFKLRDEVNTQRQLFYAFIATVLQNWVVPLPNNEVINGFTNPSPEQVKTIAEPLFQEYLVGRNKLLAKQKWGRLYRVRAAFLSRISP